VASEVAPLSDHRRRDLRTGAPGYRAAVDDRALVAAMVAGDPRGLDGAYRAYADRLYAYARSVLHNADSAADAVHDTFVIAAQRVGDLRDPDRLRSWLYTIARNECLRILRAARRGAPLTDADEPVADPVDPTRGIHADQLRELVRAASQGLSDNDREMIELAVRHDLGAAEVGSVLGVSTDHAHARMSRARTQLHRSLGALLVARAGGARCATLTELTRGWDGVFTPLLRKRVSRHIERCSRCTERQSELLNPAQLLPAYAALPFLPVPAIIWERVASATTGGPAAATASSSGSPPADGSSGTVPSSGGQPSAGSSTAGSPTPGSPTPGSPTARPVPSPVAPIVGRAQVPVRVPVSHAHGPHEPDDLAYWPEPRGRSPFLIAGVALLVLLLCGAGTGVAWWQTDGFRTLTAGGPAPTSAPAATPTTTATTVAPTPTPTPTPVATPTPTPPPTTTTTTTRPVITVTIVPFNITAEGDADCIGALDYRITVTATHNRPLGTARLYWKAGSVTQDLPMTPSGPGKVKATTGLIIAPEATWWVTAESAGGQDDETDPVTIDSPC
jgi:RNA polymerase sigma factor (sigma-70 family)